MKKLKWVAGLALAMGLVVLPGVAQGRAQRRNRRSRPPSPSQGGAGKQWNEIGRKLIIIAEEDLAGG